MPLWRSAACLSLLLKCFAEEKVYQVGLLTKDRPTTITDAGDKEDSAGGMSIKVKGKSGKFSYYHVTETDERKVDVEFDAVTELDANGDEVGKDGQIKHSIKDFKNQNFAFSDITEVQIGNATANLLTFSSEISEVGKLRVDTYIVSKGGLAEAGGGEWWELIPGNLKFNIVFEEWNFCAPCFKQNGQEEHGQFISFEIEVKGKSKTANKTSGKGGKGGKGGFDLGGGAEVLLTSQYSADGQELVMPEGYPYVETKGNKQVFVFMFSKFNQSLLYDPVLGSNSTKGTPSPNPGESGAFGLGASSLAMLFALLACAAPLA